MSNLYFTLHLQGIRHNHKLEGAVAIARLGGSKEYVEKYFEVIDKRYVKYTGLEDDEAQLLERDFLQVCQVILVYIGLGSKIT